MRRASILQFDCKLCLCLFVLLACLPVDQYAVAQVIINENVNPPKEAEKDDDDDDDDDEGDDNNNDNNNNNGGGFFGLGGGRGGFGGAGSDPLGQRIRAIAMLMKAQGDFLKAQGEYAVKMSEARKKIAEAVDLELDNWKKKVVIYFERQEENLRGRMRVRDLYDMKADQTLRLKDTAAKRRYEYVTRHTGNTGGTAKNLNFLLDLFVGTPIGYGIPIEELFASNPAHDRWKLTPDMLHQLKVRTKSSGGAWLEFRLDQPTVMAMDWPVFFRQPSFQPYRQQVEALNDALSRSSDAGEQQQIIAELDNAFAYLSRGFFQAYGEGSGRAQLDSRSYRQLLRAEEFLVQKSRELQLLMENPESAVSMSRTFVPAVHGKDAGTLIAWMNSRGMTFAKPSDGDEGAYQRAFTMMQELYALSDAPILDVPSTFLEVKPPPAENEDQGDEQGGGLIPELPDLSAIDIPNIQ